jgi:small redox-active disulfide protein 2
MRIEILGTGCPKCERLAENAQRAVSELGTGAEVVKVTDIQEIIKRGVIMTPALAVDGEVKSVGKVLGPDEIKGHLQEQAV